MNQQQRKIVHECGLFAGIEPEQADAMLSCGKIWCPKSP